MPPHKGWLRRTFSRKHKVEADFPVSPELESLHLEKPVHGMEEEEELRDALSPIYDQLQMKVIPSPITHTDELIANEALLVDPRAHSAEVPVPKTRRRVDLRVPVRPFCDSGVETVLTLLL